MRETGKLAGKRALVTGAGTGIGLEIALECGRQGADLVLHYSHTPDAAELAAQEIQSMGRRAATIKVDFTDPDASARLGGATLDFLGGIDCLVNNAGITFNSPFLKVQPQQLDTLFDVNFRTPYLLTQLLCEPMVKQGSGSICNLASIHGLQGAPEHSAYAATKGAIIACTRALAVELGYRGIRVNSIAPGWITVDAYATAIPGFNLKQAAEDAQNKVPVARYGIPLDVAKMAVFLCSEDAGFITGQTMVVDGGTTALMSLISDFRTESTARFGKGYLDGLAMRTALCSDLHIIPFV
jgi:NAD(P)-dependent dehydrogenase (short-subunit alcohol dehydrogenase family)